MSFILDALKKSESERQVQDTPGIAPVPQGSQRAARPVWTWALGALLFVNIAVLTGVLLRPQPASPTADVAGKRVETPASSGGDTAHAEPAITPRVVQAAPAEVAPPQQQVRREQPVAEVRDATPAVAAELAIASRTRKSSVRDGLSSFNELRAAGVLRLSDLHLDIHVYSEQSADRFVFVNMSKYKEKATLDEGPTIREITPEGVVLVHDGIAFLLPRE